MDIVDSMSDFGGATDVADDGWEEDWRDDGGRRSASCFTCCMRSTRV